VYELADENLTGSDFLSDVKPGKYFWLENGQSIKNLKELVGALEVMHDDIFNTHVDAHKNDFASWVKYVIKDEMLFEKMIGIKSKEGMLDVLVKHIGQLEKRSKRTKTKIKHIAKKIKTTVANKADAVTKKVKKSAQKKEKIPRPVPRHRPSSMIIDAKLDEILTREREIDLKEEKIRDIEERIEQKLSEKKTVVNQHEHKFFNTDFVQGLLIGLLIGIIGFLVYIRFIG